MRCIRFKGLWARFGLDSSSAFEPAWFSCLRIISTARRNVFFVERRTDPNQCLTTSKIASTVLVCAGILVFTTGKQKVERVLLPSAPSMEEL